MGSVWRIVSWCGVIGRVRVVGLFGLGLEFGGQLFDFELECRLFGPLALQLCRKRAVRRALASMPSGVSRSA